MKLLDGIVSCIFISLGSSFVLRLQETREELMYLNE